MSGTLNIGGDPNDRSYRYKMPRLVGKVEGRGNGIKTRIVNCAEIASSLHRKPAVLTKFFGCELGAQSRWDEKEESAIVNGAFETNILQEKLCDSFLPKFVLCPNCGLPETDMKVKKEVVKFECAACGYAGNADMGHKLITFIIADNKKDKKDKKEKDAKEAKEKKKEKKAAGEDDGEKSEKKEEKSSDKKEKKSKDKDKEKKKEKKHTKKEKKNEESDEEEWFTDITEEAVEARRIAEMEDMSKSGTALVDGDDDEGNTVEAPAEDEKSESSEAADEMAALTVDDGKVDEYLEGLMELVGDNKKSKAVLAAATEWAEGLEDPNKAALLGVIAKIPEHISKQGGAILKVMYDADYVTDEEIFAWFDNADQDIASVAAAGAFVQFLKD